MLITAATLVFYSLLSAVAIGGYWFLTIRYGQVADLDPNGPFMRWFRPPRKAEQLSSEKTVLQPQFSLIPENAGLGEGRQEEEEEVELFYRPFRARLSPQEAMHAALEARAIKVSPEQLLTEWNELFATTLAGREFHQARRSKEAQGRLSHLLLRLSKRTAAGPDRPESSAQHDLFKLASGTSTPKDDWVN
jgi:hypothetical protein